jgi:hypothetical protein
LGIPRSICAAPIGSFDRSDAILDHGAKKRIARDSANAAVTRLRIRAKICAPADTGRQFFKMKYASGDERGSEIARQKNTQGEVEAVWLEHGEIAVEIETPDRTRKRVEGRPMLQGFIVDKPF